jgi:hypothetical protein
LLSSSEATFFRCLFYQQIFSHEILPVQHGSSYPAFPLRGHLHKGNASRLTGLPVLYNLDRHDASGFREKGFEFGFGGLGRKIGYVDLLIHLSSMDISVLLKHSMQSSFLSLGGETGVMTSFPHPAYMTL